MRVRFRSWAWNYDASLAGGYSGTAFLSYECDNQLRDCTLCTQVGDVGARVEREGSERVAMQVMLDQRLADDTERRHSYHSQMEVLMLSLEEQVQALRDDKADKLEMVRVRWFRW